MSIILSQKLKFFFTRIFISIRVTWLNVLYVRDMDICYTLLSFLGRQKYLKIWIFKSQILTIFLCSIISGSKKESSGSSSSAATSSTASTSASSNPTMTMTNPFGNLVPNPAELGAGFLPYMYPGIGGFLPGMGVLPGMVPGMMPGMESHDIDR